MNDYWTVEAAKLGADAAGDPWRELVRRYLAANLPERLDDLERRGQLEAFLTVAVAGSREYQERMEEALAEAGDPNAAMLAEQEALRELMPTIEDQAPTVTETDVEGAEADEAAAAEAHLLRSSPSQK
jgi:hypothetical protein